MELKSNYTSPVLTDPSPLNKSRLGIHSSLMPFSQAGVGPSFSGKYVTVTRKKPAKLDDVTSNGWLDAMKSHRLLARSSIKVLILKSLQMILNLATAVGCLSIHQRSTLLSKL
ncbi:hypothetical protein Ddye_016630 [Dipteronia dyeriana]|uniref:Uncharacterized protein n=1 Tax=Dipteronia dyeriana TaxID=168575 RepID=A0AAD9WZS0_9ROSI|nr:hypothetical protein Ddye_016630 [Dipteronia dyeriana]